jgi:hypothetical protein
MKHSKPSICRQLSEEKLPIGSPLAGHRCRILVSLCSTRRRFLRKRFTGPVCHDQTLHFSGLDHPRISVVGTRVSCAGGGKCHKLPTELIPDRTWAHFMQTCVGSDLESGMSHDRRDQKTGLRLEADRSSFSQAACKLFSLRRLRSTSRARCVLAYATAPRCLELGPALASISTWT